jgi:hypothetical protein
VHATKATAHRVGALYFVFMIVAIIHEVVFPKLTVAGDAAATARNIMAGEPMYRLGLLLTFSTLVIFIFLVALLHKLFKDVDRFHVLTMVLLVCVGAAAALASLLAQFAPLVLLSGAGYLAAFTKPPLEALSLALVSAPRSGAVIATAFWGLWLFPFGLLVMKSGFFPRILGILLLVAGGAYVTFAVTAITLPEYRQVVARYMMPLYFGEVPIILWMLVKGARVPPEAVTAS